MFITFVNTRIVGFDHINRNPPVLIRTPKLTRFEPAQYWGGGPPGNSVVLNPFFVFDHALTHSYTTQHTDGLDVCWFLYSLYSTYSSVGRAGDCSCYSTDISRSLVRIRVGGFFATCQKEDAFSGVRTHALREDQNLSLAPWPLGHECFDGFVVTQMHSWPSG